MPCQRVTVRGLVESLVLDPDSLGSEDHLVRPNPLGVLAMMP